MAKEFPKTPAPLPAWEGSAREEHREGDPFMDLHRVPAILHAMIQKHFADLTGIEPALHGVIAQRLLDQDHGYLLAANIKAFHALSKDILLKLVRLSYERDVLSYLETHEVSEKDQDEIYLLVKQRAHGYILAAELNDAARAALKDGFDVFGSFTEGLGGGDNIESGYFLRLTNGDFASLGWYDNSMYEGISFAQYGKDPEEFFRGLAANSSWMRTLLLGRKPTSWNGESLDYNYAYLFFPEGRQFLRNILGEESENLQEE